MGHNMEIFHLKTVVSGRSRLVLALAKQSLKTEKEIHDVYASCNVTGVVMARMQHREHIVPSFVQWA